MKFYFIFFFCLFTETMFMQTIPSVLASACICAATRGINAPSAKFALRDVCRLTQADPLEVEFTVRHIENVVAKETAALQMQQQQAIKQQQYSSCGSSAMLMVPTLLPPSGKLTSGDGGCEMGQPETPTDVQDVYF